LDSLKIARHDSTRIDFYLRLADIFLSEANADKSIDHSKAALALAQNLDDDHRRLQAYDRLISVHFDLKYDLDAATKYLTKAKAIGSTNMTLNEQALFYGHEGKIFLALNDFVRAHQLFLKQLMTFEKENNKLGIAKANYDLGWLFFEQNDFRQALANFIEALKPYRQLHNITGKMKTLNAIGQVHGRTNDYQKNLIYCSDALLFAKTINNRLEIARINTNLGFACRHLDRLGDALDYYNAALEVAQDMRNDRLIAETATELGNTYLAVGNLSRANSSLQLAVEAVYKTDSKALKKNVYAALAQYYEKTGQSLLAFDCLKRMVAIKDELFNEEHTRQLINNQIRYETERRDEEVKKLRARELENNLIIQKQRQSNYALIVLILLVLVAVGALYKAFQRKKMYNQLLEQEVKKRTKELQQSNMELKESNRLLEQSNAELERFAYIASHDLKSPLRNIISFLNLIERRLKNSTDASLHEYLHFATENAKQMNQLIQDVLEYSIVEGKDSPVAPVNLNDTILLVLQNLKAEMKQKNATVIAEPLPVIMGNSVHILQLLQNLIGNGIKYNQSPHAQVHVSYRSDGISHIFAVKDNGIGISPEFHSLIFEMFKRLHTKEEYPGSGIGLALCKKIVNKMGGDIWLESQQEQGTIVYFSLPSSQMAEGDSGLEQVTKTPNLALNGEKTNGKNQATTPAIYCSAASL
jgi:signal transduction histidine kinase